MTVFNPKLIVIESDNVTMNMFKEMVGEKIFNQGLSSGSNRTLGSQSKTQKYDTFNDVSYIGLTNSNNKTEWEKLKFYTFTGMEICDDEELSILENNTYLFVSNGMNKYVRNFKFNR